MWVLVAARVLRRGSGGSCDVAERATPAGHVVRGAQKLCWVVQEHADPGVVTVAEQASNAGAAGIVAGAARVVVIDVEAARAVCSVVGSVTSRHGAGPTLGVEHFVVHLDGEAVAAQVCCALSRRSDRPVSLRSARRASPCLMCSAVGPVVAGQRSSAVSAGELARLLGGLGPRALPVARDGVAVEASTFRAAGWLFPGCPGVLDWGAAVLAGQFDGFSPQEGGRPDA
jgi:hypothetical protein